MPDKVDPSSARKAPTVSRAGRHPVILRVSSLVVASILSLLMITTVIPPIVADQSEGVSDDALAIPRHGPVP